MNGGNRSHPGSSKKIAIKAEVDKTVVRLVLRRGEPSLFLTVLALNLEPLLHQINPALHAQELDLSVGARHDDNLTEFPSNISQD